jgi:SAM-dependent methyltransferase
LTVYWTPEFDRIAPTYDKLWSGTPVGRLQREAIWRHTGELLRRGSRVLDLGCGTGDDAVMMAERGVQVTGIDASLEMVRVAQRRGVDARVGPIETIGNFSEPFDGVWSNFGALNCVEKLDDLRDRLADALVPNGWLAICLMGRICLWETVWYSLDGSFRKATRRWSGTATSSLASRVFYPTARSVCRSFAPRFKLVSLHGIGLTVPPSYVTGIADAVMDRFAKFDRRAASWPVLRSLSDHQLMIFRRSDQPGDQRHRRAR